MKTVDYEGRLRDRGRSMWKATFLPYAQTEHTFQVPAGAEIVAAEWEGDHGVLWLYVDPTQPRESRRLRFVPDQTGPPPRELRVMVVQTSAEGLPRGRYVSTIRNQAGCAYHVFEVN